MKSYNAFTEKASLFPPVIPPLLTARKAGRPFLFHLNYSLFSPIPLIPILVALLFCLMGTAGLSQSTSLGFASLCHFFSGIGNAFCFLSCIMLISRWFPKERQAFLIGLMITIGMLGGVVAQRPFSILAEHFSWRQALLIDALIGVGLFAIIFTFVKDAPEKMKKVKTESISFFEGVK